MPDIKELRIITVWYFVSIFRLNLILSFVSHFWWNNCFVRNTSLINFDNLDKQLIKLYIIDYFSWYLCFLSILIASCNRFVLISYLSYFNSIVSEQSYLSISMICFLWTTMSSINTYMIRILQVTIIFF